MAKQSEAAKEYLRLKEELKKYDVNQFLMETEGLRFQMKEVDEKEVIVSRDLEEAKKTHQRASESSMRPLIHIYPSWMIYFSKPQ